MEQTSKAGNCTEIVRNRYDIGVLGKGTHSSSYTIGWCPRTAVDGGSLCKSHQAKADKISAELARRIAK